MNLLVKNAIIYKNVYSEKTVNHIVKCRDNYNYIERLDKFERKTTLDNKKSGSDKKL